MPRVKRNAGFKGHIGVVWRQPEIKLLTILRIPYDQIWSEDPPCINQVFKNGSHVGLTLK